MPTLADPLGWFTLQFPEGWREATEDCVTVLRSPDEIGVVYVSGGRHAGGRHSGFGGVEFLLRFLDYIGVRVDVAAIQERQGVGCRMYCYCRSGQGEHWQYWSITDDETALLVSYQCPLAHAGEEAAVVETMVRSVRLYGSGPSS